MARDVRFGANEVSPLNSLWWLTTHSGSIDRKREFGAVANADRDEWRQIAPPLSADDPEMENGSHRSLGDKRLSPLPAALDRRSHTELFHPALTPTVRH